MNSNKAFRVKSRKQSQRGMTLIEVVCAVVLAGLFFGVFFSLIIASTSSYRKQQMGHKAWLEKQTAYYFIQEELELAKVICVYVHPEGYKDISPGTALCHGSSLIEGKAYLVNNLVFDENERDERGKFLTKLLVLKKDNKSRDGVFEIVYQGQTLIEGVEGMTVTKVGDTMSISAQLRTGQTITWTILEKEKKKVKHGVLHTT